MLHVLTKPKWHAALAPHADCVFAESVDDLAGGACLVAFATGVIVPPDVLARYDRAYNVHPAPPTYPGRDPHHWAAYDGVTKWGATIHVMTEKVDAGPIVGVIEVELPPSDPHTYRQLGEDLALTLFAGHAEDMASHSLAPIGVEWAGPKRSRAGLLAMLDMRGLVAEEVARRRFAFRGFESAMVLG